MQKYSEVISKLLYLPKATLKLHLDGKLQIILVCYLYYEREFSFCQLSSLLSVKPFIPILRTIMCFGVTIVGFFH